jgi:hypothetical protein
MGLRLASLGGVAARFVPQAQAAHAAGFAESSLAPLTESALRLISLIPAPAGAGLVLPLSRQPLRIARPLEPAWNPYFRVLPCIKRGIKKPRCGAGQLFRDQIGCLVLGAVGDHS